MYNLCDHYDGGKAKDKDLMVKMKLLITNRRGCKQLKTRPHCQGIQRRALGTCRSDHSESLCHRYYQPSSSLNMTTLEAKDVFIKLHLMQL